MIALLTILSAAVLPAGRFVRGEAIVRLAPAERSATLVRPGLDELFRRWRVSAVRPLLTGPDSLARSRGLDRQYLITFPPETNLDALLADFAAAPSVEYACPNALLRLDSLPDDQLYPEQWHLGHSGAPQAWALAHGDSNVRLAVLADGTHWTHPDLEANWWVNPAEDINHNGRFDSLPAGQGGDLDSVDQDGNGCADDVIGYDFYDGDPNPAPSEPLASGTHGSGVQNAVTDNAIGVAAPPWNVRSFAARCGSGGSISLYAAIAAIYYLVPAGVWSFSMPFGSASPSQPLADACLYAWDSGTIPCAPAGTDGTEVIRYPAGYPGVLAIAAHGRDNRKSPFSNYGTWIDFTAPGVDILATAGPDGYEARSGTSVACNIVVGILGWLKSAVPDISRDSAVSWLRNLCDTMPDPLYWQGKLGAGRVRMSRNAVGAAEQREPGPITAVRNSVCRGVLVLAPGGSGTSSLLNPAGRQVLALHSGPNDVSSLAPGVYFVRSGPAAVTRVVLLR